jgi:hypothetical protein
MPSAKDEQLLKRLSLIQQIKKRPIKDLEQDLASASMELAMLQEAEKADPAREYIDLIQKTGATKGEINYLTLNQWRKLYGKSKSEMPSKSILSKDGKHVSWELVLDDKAKTLGYHGNKADEQFHDDIIAAKERRDKIEAKKYELAVLDRERVSRQKDTPSYEYELERQKAINEGGDPELIANYDNIIAELKSNERYGELHDINKTRTPQAIAQDDSILHSKVISPDDPKTEAWEADPGGADVLGIDTPDEKRARITPTKDPAFRRPSATAGGAKPGGGKPKTSHTKQSRYGPYFHKTGRLSRHKI